MKKVKIKIGGKPMEFAPGLVRGEDLCRQAGIGESQRLLMDRTGIDIPVLPDDYLVLKGSEGFSVDSHSEIPENPPLRKPVCFLFNDKPLSESEASKCAKMTGRELKTLDKELSGEIRLFVDLEGQPDREIQDDWQVIVREDDKFITIPKGDESGDEVDIELCAKSNRRPPKVDRYRIMIDGQKHTVASPKLDGKTILAQSGKSSDEWLLTQKFKGGKRERVEPGDVVNFAARGIERFETTPKQVNQGRGHREFELPEEDAKYLDANYDEWDALGNPRAVVVRDFRLPVGYDRKMANLMVLIPPNYPGAPFDMFYLDPPISRADGRAIPALANESHHGRAWQRWSRHYATPPEIPSLAGHVEYVMHALQKDAAA